MFLGDFPARGSVRGGMAIALSKGKIFVQAQNAQLRDASIHGIPISAITGTMSFQNGLLRVYSAQAQAAGGTVVAAGSIATAPKSGRGRLALATTQLNAGDLHGLGVPISAGSLRAVGAVAPGGSIPNLDAGVVLTAGSAAGYGPFDTSAEISIAADAMHVHNAIARVGGTFARLEGSVSDLTARAPGYDITANVPIGEIAPMARLANLSRYHAQGSFEGEVRVSGSGTNPRIDGSVGVPVGEINGLGFRDAAAQISVSRQGAAVRDAGVTVGTTVAHFSATLAKNEVAVAIRAPRADLSDFNDYFDTGDTLDGSGYVSLAFSHFDHLTFTSGDLNLHGFRYRSLPIGDTVAKWTSLSSIAQGSVAIGGEHGRLRASGSIGFESSSNLAQIVTGSRYNITGTLADLDLTTWLPALGFAQFRSPAESTRTPPSRASIRTSRSRAMLRFTTARLARCRSKPRKFPPTAPRTIASSYRIWYSRCLRCKPAEAAALGSRRPRRFSCRCMRLRTICRGSSHRSQKGTSI